MSGLFFFKTKEAVKSREYGGFGVANVLEFF